MTTHSNSREKGCCPECGDHRDNDGVQIDCSNYDCPCHIETTKALINDEIVNQAAPTGSRYCAGCNLCTKLFSTGEQCIASGRECWCHKRGDEPDSKATTLSAPHNHLQGLERFAEIVWDALKDDHVDLRRQQIILNAAKAFTKDALTSQRTSIAARVEGLEWPSEEHTHSPSGDEGYCYDCGNAAYNEGLKDALSAIREEV